MQGIDFYETVGKRDKMESAKVPAKHGVVPTNNALLAASFLSPTRYLFVLNCFFHNWPRTMKRYLPIPSSLGDSSCDPTSTGPIDISSKGIGPNSGEQ